MRTFVWIGTLVEIDSVIVNAPKKIEIEVEIELSTHVGLNNPDLNLYAS